jgi:hypothetical protein
MSDNKKEQKIITTKNYPPKAKSTQKDLESQI